jgi:L-alanine-DL-glutamate epimerase-like enolase superfamily enzyme
MSADLKIVELKAYPTSFPVPPENRVALGIGRAIKRDAVVVKATTAGGLVGWGESHDGRAHTAVAKLIETTLGQLVLGMDAADVVGVWTSPRRAVSPRRCASPRWLRRTSCRSTRTAR